MKNTKRTTIYLDEDLFRKAKKAAVEQNKSLREVTQQALREYLKISSLPPHRFKARFRSYSMGRLKGGMHREEIYRDI